MHEFLYLMINLPRFWGCNRGFGGVIELILHLILAHLYESTETYCCHYDVGVGVCSHFKVLC